MKNIYEIVLKKKIKSKEKKSPLSYVGLLI